MSVKPFVIGATVAGFVMPTFLIFVGIGLMGAHGVWADAYRTVVHVTCPFGLADTGGWANALGKSFLNALLYGFVVSILAAAWRQLNAENATYRLTLAAELRDQ